MNAPILIVEDESIIAADIHRMLVSFGYAVAEPVASAGEALRAVAANRPALVLMDIRLRGELDGIDTAAILKRRWSIPVVYLTSHSDEATLARAKQTAPYGYVIKPYEEHDLRAAIEIALSKHEIEQRAAERDRWFATTLHSLGDAVIAVDCDKRITFLNPVAEQLTGWSAAAAEGRAIDEVFKLIDREGARVPSPMAQALDQLQPANLPPETRLVTRSSGPIEVDDSAAPIVDDGGRLLGGVLVFRDVTDARRLERRAAQTERLASLGQLIAGLAHEINNPLMTIGANSELIDGCLTRLDAMGADRAIVADARSLLGDARAAIGSIVQILHGLRRFATIGASGREVLEVSEVLEDALRLAIDRLRDAATVELELGTTPFVLADESRLVQVFVALLLNAAQAMEIPDARKNVIRVSTRTDEQGRAAIEIRDNGRGIPAAIIGRVFEPFFTTRRVGEGMGLGLSIVHGTIGELGGEVTVESQVGVGTVFRIVLPPAPARAEATVKRSVAPAPVPGEIGVARVLVVDDDERVGRAVQRALQSAHHVERETDPVHALARIEQGEEFDVVLCDVMMPGMSGPEFAARLRERHPHARPVIVFVTGGTLDSELDDELAISGSLVLQKPVSRASLLDAVAAAVSTIGPPS